jgi:hypothetical protein
MYKLQVSIEGGQKMQEKPFLQQEKSLLPMDERLKEHLSKLEVGAPAIATYYLEVSAAIRPPGNPPPPTVSVPRGYGFYYQRTFNNNWTDNRDAGQRPLEGFDFEEHDEYIPAARRAQLVTILDSQWYSGYEKSLDRGEGGTSYVANDTAGDWSLRWYMNDSMDANNHGYSFYDDNGGTANIDVVVFRLLV